MLNWASEEGRQWVIEHGAAVELGISLDVSGMPPLVFLSPRSGPDADELADLERVLMSMLLAGNDEHLAGQCARGGFAFQWRCRLLDLARACTNWPHDVAPRVYASADKALTIEINKRKHARVGEEKHLGDLTPVIRDAEQTLARAQALPAKLGGRDRRMEVATELIAELRPLFDAEIARDGAGCTPIIIAYYQRVEKLLAEWDALKG